MENAKFEISYNGTVLYFDGRTLVDAEYEERPGSVDFGANWFVDEEDRKIEIEVTETKGRTPDAYIGIEGQLVKKLEIVKSADGITYVEPDHEDF